MRPDNLSEAEYEVLARIAHRYYVDDRTQEEVAREFGLSRPKVQRLLERARWSGVVDIRIVAPPWLNLDLETRLRAEFGLADAIVASRRADPQSQREAVARSAAQFLERRLHDGAVIAIGHGRDAGEVPRFFRPQRRLDCEFVSAMGGSPRVDTPTNPNAICQALASSSGGRSLAGGGVVRAGRPGRRGGPATVLAAGTVSGVAGSSGLAPPSWGSISIGLL